MTYVIAEPCLGTKDKACADVCPVDCIHENLDGSSPQLYINPNEWQPPASTQFCTTILTTILAWRVLISCASRSIGLFKEGYMSRDQFEGRKLTRVLVLAGGLAVVGPLGLAALSQSRAATSASQPFPTAELQRLDQDVQARFAVIVRSNFGMSRIVRRSETHALFHPDTSEEQQHIAALKSQGQDVLFYVLGRNGGLDNPYSPLLKGPGIMTGPANKLPLEKEQSAILSRAGLRAGGMPVPISNGRTVDRRDLPRLVELKAIGDEALKQTDGKAGPGVQRSLTSGGWTVVAVPIPASTQKCVDCHLNWEAKTNEVALNKPLGAALYAYRTLSEANTPQVTAQAPNAPATSNNQQQARLQTGG